MTTADGTATNLSPVAADAVYRVLGNRRRRCILFVLADRGEPTDIGTLAERVAALENERRPEEVTYEQRKSAYTGLHQNHLPRLEAAGLIRSEREWDRIELTGRGAELWTRLYGPAENDGVDEDDEDGTGVRSLHAMLFTFGIGVGAGVVLAAVSLAGVSGYVYLGASLVVLGGLGLARTYSGRR